MSGLFGGGGSSKREPTQAELKAEEAQARQEERATAQEQTEMQQMQKRSRLRRRGGMRLLFSPLRRERTMSNMLGGGSGGQ